MDFEPLELAGLVERLDKTEAELKKAETEREGIAESLRRARKRIQELVDRRDAISLKIMRRTGTLHMFDGPNERIAELEALEAARLAPDPMPDPETVVGRG